MTEELETLPRERAVRRFDGYACPHEIGIQFAKINELIFEDEYVYVVEQTHAIDLNYAERPELATDETRELPAPGFGMSETEKRELGKAVKKLRRIA